MLKYIKYTLNKKIIIGITVSCLIIIMILFSNLFPFDYDIVNILEQNTNTVILPLDISLENLTILSISDNDLTAKIKFKTYNPNIRSVILQMVKYELYINDMLIQTNSIGERANGMVTSSNYFTILSENHIVLTDKIIIKNNSDKLNVLWDSIIDDKMKWKIKFML